MMTDDVLMLGVCERFGLIKVGRLCGLWLDCSDNPLLYGSGLLHGFNDKTRCVLVQWFVPELKIPLSEFYQTDPLSR
jgi:hypothetical protein